MKRPLYPSSSRDRLLFWLSVTAAVLTVYFLARGLYWAALSNACATIYNFGLSYFKRDKTIASDSVGEYEQVINSISAIGVQLNQLNAFLVREQQKVEDAKATVQELDSERAALEPVVATHRATVEAILSAHSERMAKSAWKERLIGFGIGIIASVLASVIYELFKH